MSGTFQHISICGRLVADPVVNKTGSGLSVSTVRLAINEKWTTTDDQGNTQQRERATFVPVVLWRKSAENVARFLSKGSRLHVVGKLHNRTYTDSSGIERQVLEVVADPRGVTFMDRRRDSAPAAQSEEAPPPQDDSDAPF